MTEIEQKLNELSELLKFVPQDCKGNSKEATLNRHKFLKIGSVIHDLKETLKNIE